MANIVRASARVELANRQVALSANYVLDEAGAGDDPFSYETNWSLSYNGPGGEPAASTSGTEPDVSGGGTVEVPLDEQPGVPIGTLRLSASFTFGFGSVSATCSVFDAALERTGQTIGGTSTADIVLGGYGADTIRAGGGNDIVYGLGGVDRVFGEGGNDTLTGDGKDVLTGGSGDDQFYVRGSDTVMEAAGGGRDVVTASTSYALAAGQEVETLEADNRSGTAAIKLFGNEYGQTIRGSAGDNHIEGRGGDDILYGRDGLDILLGGAGNDTLTDDGYGAARMIGGIGNDTYYVSGSETIEEANGQGIDTIYTSVRFTLATGQEIEKLIASGRQPNAPPIDLYGNERSQTITGDSGANRIEGRAGNDTLQGQGGNDRLEGGIGDDRLYGGEGLDILAGGTGRDTFFFDTVPGPRNVDHVTDFTTIDDTIALKADPALFADIGTRGALDAARFKDITDGAVLDADDRILYDQDSGRLYYDRDGSGSAGRIQFAILDTLPAVTAADFMVA